MEPSPRITLIFWPRSLRRDPGPTLPSRSRWTDKNANAPNVTAAGSAVCEVRVCAGQASCVACRAATTMFVRLTTDLSAHTLSRELDGKGSCGEPGHEHSRFRSRSRVYRSELGVDYGNNTKRISSSHRQDSWRTTDTYAQCKADQRSEFL